MKTPEETAKEIGRHIFSWGLSCYGLNPSDFKEEKAKAIKMLTAVIRTERAVVDELRKENTAMRIFAKKAVDGLKDAYDCLVEAHGQHMDCEKATDQEHEMMHICERGYIKIDVLLTDPICIELLK